MGIAGRMVMLGLRRWYNRKAVAVEDPVRRTVVIGGSIRNAATTKDDDDDDDDTAPPPSPTEG